MPTNYARGVAAERKAMKLLEALGYTVVRSAGSHGLVDVIGWNAAGMKLVQCKTGRAKMLTADLEAFELLEVPPHTTKEVWTWSKRYQRQPDVRVIG